MGHEGEAPLMLKIAKDFSLEPEIEPTKNEKNIYSHYFIVLINGVNDKDKIFPINIGP